MSKTSLLERLSAHRTLSSLPPGEIAWIAERGKLRHLDSGDVLTSIDRPVDGLHIVLDGHLTIHVDRGAGRRKIMEWRGGDVTGLMPYSRLVSPPGNVIAEEPTELVTVPRQDIPGMICDCHELTAILVHVMLDRARHFTSSYLQDEKLVSLGKLAAGLAHELNNPASAIARSAGTLSASLAEADSAALLLGSAGITDQQIAAAQKIRDACLTWRVRSVLSPLELEERENAIADWLEDHNADPGAAEALAETEVTLEMLEQLVLTINGPALNAALRWMAAGCAARRLTAEIQQASSRIYDLVAAIKGFTQMDRESVAEPVKLAQGLADTLVVLRAKAKSKSIGVTIRVDQDLPCVNGFGGELNQIWANLIDNALDASNEGGRVDVVARREGDHVIVEITDDGPGIPSEIRDRIFDPFFTTKPVGKGTGLGLDIVRRLVQRHNGQIELDVKPGRTQFRVILPAIKPQCEGAR
jgi:signal transduction histidine kinase